MGGDRDGNERYSSNYPRVLWLSRWQAADLYLRDIENLRWELSIQSCSEEMVQAIGSPHQSLIVSIYVQHVSV